MAALLPYVYVFRRPSPALRPLVALVVTAAALALLAGPRPAAAQPTPLRLGAPAGAYADRLHPVGWSPDGRYLAYLTNHTGGGATVGPVVLAVQDLSDDRVVAEEFLTRRESEVEHDVGRVWRRERARVRRALARYGVRESAFALSTFPYRGQPGDPYTADLSVRRAGGGRVAGYTLSLRDGRGRSKVLETHAFESYAPAYSVRVAGALAAPSGDRVAVVVEVVASGYEGERTYVYRLVGARTGDGF